MLYELKKKIITKDSNSKLLLQCLENCPYSNF